MKRLLCLLSASVLILAACGDKKEESEKEETSSLDAKQAKTKEKPKIKDNSVEIKGVKVKIVGTEIVPKGTTEYQDDDVLVVKYEVTNNSKDDNEVKPTRSYLKVFEAYQDSKDSEKRLDYGHVRGETYDSERDKGEDNIKKGSTISSIETYKLNDLESPVLLKAKDQENYEDPNIGSIKINIKDKKSSDNKSSDKKSSEDDIKSEDMTDL
ncbi:DUF5067 domain-containing protein [Staphylococcus simulans]|nr:MULTISPECIES: DUF5067 domain-containing protein [Staphylococcus]MDU0420452.1 DUF5067 domain-containing protein [Staphylococcus simulans]MDU0467186.1 DUF5067 domain-containing protein [Staphylococcus simulans]OFU79427.1 hypothetical protein HMPREF3110_04440 [Staphylococcus sp. HMSC10C03]PTJ50931.1 DUF5067 domain-containing protein [Staphylococcus simulans]